MAATNDPVLLSEYVDKLPGHINTVLIQVGKLFKHQATPEQRLLLQQKTQAQDAIVKVTRQFHDALDEVELELMNARAVIERDLGKLREQQAARETAQREAVSSADPKPVLEDKDVVMEEPINEDVPKIQTPPTDPIENAPDQSAETTDIVIDAATATQPEGENQQDQKEVGVSDDLFGEAISDDFGPIDDTATFVLYNTTSGGDFDIDFSMPIDGVTTTTMDAQLTTAPATTAAASTLVADSDFNSLMQGLGDIGAAETTNMTGLEDMDFGTVESNPDGPAINPEDDPFKPADSVDDDFGSWFDT